MPAPGDEILFDSTKHGGGLHYRFPATVVHCSDTLLAVYRDVGVEMESYRGRWTAGIGMLCLAWTDRFWNLCVHWDADGAPREHYVNIATPADWSGGALRLCDLDLDLVLRARDGSIKLCDADEFDEHRTRLAYPPELVERCLQTSVEVAAMMRERAWPFDGSLYAWRPGRALQLP